jgi:N-acetylglucosamine-6-phosphate deacetylase
VENGRVAEIAPRIVHSDGEIFDAGGGYVLPGFVDIHTHGAVNRDFCDADGLDELLAYYARCGVTTVVPATMSFPEETLARAIERSLPYLGRDGFGAVLRGINMEGPFLAAGRCGAQNPDYLAAPDAGLWRRLSELSGGRVLMVDMAPELPSGIDFIREASRECAVSLAHTDADYETAIAAFDAGATHLTHIFNGMPPFGHRAPGVIGAALDRALSVELISDGIHVHPSAVRAVFSMFGAERVCLVSDSMRAAGMPDGVYDLGGQEVVLKDGRATLAGGNHSIAGSVTSLPDMCRRAISFGIPMERAIRASTLNPAKAARIGGEAGSLSPGRRADIVVWDKDLKTRAVFVGGQIIGETI